MKITANLFVDEIEKSVGVPDADKLAFVIVVRDGAELMMQTLESVRFEDVLKRLSGYPITMPQRTTSYGMREIGVRYLKGT